MVTPPVLNYPFSTVPVSPSSRLRIFPSSRLNPSYPSFSSIRSFFLPFFFFFWVTVLVFLEMRSFFLSFFRKNRLPEMVFFP